MKPRVLTFDIEIAPNKVYTWGFYEQNVIKVIEPWYVLTVAWKWLGEKKVYAMSLPDYPLYQKDHKNDRDLIKDIWNLLDKADIVVTQNGDAFDIKKLNTRFLIHGLPPPSHYKSVDTKKTSKKYFSFVNNKLDNLGEELGIGGKLKHQGFEMWEGCMKGGKESLKYFRDMAKYNKRDIVVTEGVYLLERPYMANHPSMTVYLDDVNPRCRNCQSENLQSRGFRYSNIGKAPSFQCKDCGAWSQGKYVSVGMSVK